MTVILDASAVLALVKREPGHECVAELFASAACLISAVNWSEVLAKLAESGQPEDAVLAAAQALTPTIVPFDARQAELCGLLRPATRHLGLSLGDRACLALARQLGSTVLTADRPWLSLGEALGLDIRCIRPDQH